MADRKRRREPLAFHLIRVYETDAVTGMLSDQPLSESEATVDWGRVFAKVPARLRAACENEAEAEALARALLRSGDPRDEMIVGLLDAAFSRGFALGRDYAEHEDQTLKSFAELSASRDASRDAVLTGKKRP